MSLCYAAMPLWPYAILCLCALMPLCLYAPGHGSSLAPSLALSHTLTHTPSPAFQCATILPGEAGTLLYTASSDGYVVSYTVQADGLLRFAAASKGLV